MNVQDIINEINKDVDDTLENEDLIGWINRGIDDLTPIANIEEKKTANIGPDNAYSLPDDFQELSKVLIDKQPYDYEIWGNTLSFLIPPDSGEIELYYYRKLNHIAELIDVPEIDPAFHDLLVLYANAFNQFKEHNDDWQSRQGEVLNAYYKRKQDFANYIQRKKQKLNAKKLIKNVYSTYWG